MGQVSLKQLENSECITKTVQKCSLILQRASLPLGSEITNSV